MMPSTLVMTLGLLANKKRNGKGSYQGQHVSVVPSAKLVVVRLGFTPNESQADMGSLIAGIVRAVGK
jgi:hypothetical protein